jgi:hypothetical protein
MPITSSVIKDYKDNDGSLKEALSFTFTNGAKEQLTELKTFFKQADELEVLKLAISSVQRFKEQQEKIKKETSSL